jgi:hypothetical protein
MALFDELAKQVKDALTAEESLHDIRFVEAYPPQPKPIPLKRVTVAVDITGVRVTGGPIGGRIAERTGRTLRGRRGEYRLRLGIYVPTALGGKQCGEVFSRLCGVLLFSGPVDVQELSCGETEYRSAEDAFVLECTARVPFYLGAAEDAAPVSDIVVKGVVSG